MTLMDLFDENIITFMKVLDLYNKDSGTKMSSYTVNSMENNLRREINKQDDTIRKSDYLNIMY